MDASNEAFHQRGISTEDVRPEGNGPETHVDLVGPRAQQQQPRKRSGSRARRTIRRSCSVLLRRSTGGVFGIRDVPAPERAASPVSRRWRRSSETVHVTPAPGADWLWKLPLESTNCINCCIVFSQF